MGAKKLVKFSPYQNHTHITHTISLTVTEMLNLHVDNNVKTIMLIGDFVYFFICMCDISCRYNILSRSTIEYHGFHKANRLLVSHLFNHGVN